MRFKKLLLAGLCLAGLTNACFAQAPYIAAVALDTTYSRSGIPNSPEDLPSPLVDHKYAPDPYPWGAQVALDIRVDPYISVTGVYWSAYEQWNYDVWPGYCVNKPYYTRSNNQGYPVPDHYQPISNRSQSLSAPSSPYYLGSELRRR